MSVAYRAVQWNKHKKLYDALVVAGVVVYLLAFVGVGSIAHTGASAYDPVTLLIRATGTAAFTLIHVILAIGPLARLSDRFSPLLYNRRHLGVTTFLVALIHGVLVVFWYGSFGTGIPLINVVAGYSGLTDPGAFPFEILGLGALLIMFAMAATSHDFWLANLGPAWWKALHIKVYAAYAMLVGHVALGAVRSEPQPVLAIFTGLGVVSLTLLHAAAGARDLRQRSAEPTDSDWVDAGDADSIPDRRARVVELGNGARIAVFREGDDLRAISNVCAHQGGPLGEGAIVDGCVTCPWHGYQYNAKDGCSPPPFTEKIPTYELRVRSGRIEVNPNANPPGTPTSPASTSEDQV